MQTYVDSNTIHNSQTLKPAKVSYCYKVCMYKYVTTNLIYATIMHQ